MSTRPVAERLGTQSYTVTKRSSPFLDLVFLLKTPSLGRRFDCVTRRFLFIVRWPTGSNGALMINFGYYKEYSICRNAICIIKNKSKMSFTRILMFRIFMIIVRLKKTRIEVTLCQHVNIINLAAGFIYVT